MLSTQQVADILGVSRMTVTRVIDRGELPSTGVGTHRKVTAAAVARYREQRRLERSEALRALADDTDEAGPDHVVTTRRAVRTP
ncbi:MAG: helix-turn-helix domain-containing protein [Aeromicrobium sp.]|uniref:helix-turn-helix domain-containing protein n=1 Tax=Aeromicrobium sp. TaxID=1871063 RepID=UPI0039E3CD84